MPDINELGRLIWALYAMSRPRFDDHRELTTRRHPEENAEILDTVVRMLADWPQALYRLCREAPPIRAARYANAPSLLSGRPYQVIHAMSAGAAKSFLHAAWTSIPEGTGRALIVGRALVDRKIDQDATGMTLGEVRRALTMTPRRVAQLIQGGRLTRLDRPTRMSAVWKIEDVMEVMRSPLPERFFARKRLPKDLSIRIADAIGVPEGRMRKKLRYSLNDTINWRVLMGDKGSKIVHRVEQVTKHLLKNSLKLPALNGLLSGSDILRNRSGTYVSVCEVVDLVIRGRLCPVGRLGNTESLADLLFFSDDLLKVTQDYRSALKPTRRSAG